MFNIAKIDFHPASAALWKGYSLGRFKQDLIAGIVVGIIAIPLAIAFAIASGATPAVGLVTAMIGGFMVSAFGGNSVQIGGPTGAFIVIIYNIIELYGFEGLALATFMARLHPCASRIVQAWFGYKVHTLSDCGGFHSGYCSDYILHSDA